MPICVLSVIIAAHRKTGYIESNLKKLKGYEVIIAADEPEEGLVDIIKKYNVKASISSIRRGKWRALNEAVRLASGEILLFLDSDTKLDCDVEEVLELLKGSDAVEIRKELNSSTLLQKLSNVDFLNMFAVACLASKLRTSLGLNGAAFAIKKDVFVDVGQFRPRINEDTDLGVRLALNGYTVSIGGKAITKSPSGLKEWFKQRERWAMGGAEVLLENLYQIIRRPVLWLSALFLLFPAIIGLLLNLSIPDNYISKALFLIIPLWLPSKIATGLLFILYQKHALQNVIAIVASFFAWMAVEILIARRAGWRISFRILLLYYFIYSPLWMMLCFTALVRVLIAKITSKEVTIKDWTV